MDAGSEKVESEGKVGKEEVTITTKITDETGETSEEARTITKKEDRKVRIGVKPVAKTEEIPFNTEHEHDPILDAGKTEKVFNGTKGMVTVTTTFNKGTGKPETSVTRTGGTNAKYKYSSKTEGSFKVESETPYKIQVIEDSILDAGTCKVERGGVVGRKETIAKVKNSKEESRGDKTVTEAADKIIRIGMKPTENMCLVPEKPEIPDSPKKPDQLGTSDKPGTPDKPSNPGKPGTPDKPGSPDKSGTSEKLSNPNQPSNPDQPGNPNKPGTPDKANTPDQPGESPGNPRPSQEFKDQGQKAATSPVEKGAQKVGCQ